VVEVIRLDHKGWGWNGVIPGFGLLAEDFSEPYIHHYELRGDECVFSADIRIPYEPFCGVMGVAPARAGRVTTHPPRENAGNVDIRHLTAGATVRLPVWVNGALFSCGDCHAARATER
jgi:acetamidase/formamidase